MIDTSTPKSTAPATPLTDITELEAPVAETESMPRHTTIEFLRQFARCYMAAPLDTEVGVILN